MVWRYTIVQSRLFVNPLDRFRGCLIDMTVAVKSSWAWHLVLDNMRDRHLRASASRNHFRDVDDWVADSIFAGYRVVFGGSGADAKLIVVLCKAPREEATTTLANEGIVVLGVIDLISTIVIDQRLFIARMV